MNKKNIWDCYQTSTLYFENYKLYVKIWKFHMEPKSEIW